MGSSTNNKLVSNLAEALVDELSDSKTLNLTNDDKFDEFTDLLHEILDKQNDAEDWRKKRDDDDKKQNNDKNLEKQQEDIQNLIDTVNEYFDKKDGKNKSKKLDKAGNTLKDFDGRSKKILKIVEGLQSDNKKIKGLENKISNDSKEKRKDSLKTQIMLKKLNKDFKRSEKKQETSFKSIKRSIKEVKSKIHSFISKTFNKFKSWLLIGLLLIFAKPIWNALKSVLQPLWEETLKPKLDAWFKSIGDTIGEGFEYAKDWFKKSFPGIAEWIEKEWPKVKDWFEKLYPSIKDNFEKIKNFIETVFPILKTYFTLKHPALAAALKAYEKIMEEDDPLEKLEDERDKIAKQLKGTEEGSEEWGELNLKMAALNYEIKKLKGDFDRNDTRSSISAGGIVNTVVTRTGKQKEEDATKAVNDAQKILDEIKVIKGAASKVANQEVSDFMESKAASAETTPDTFNTSFGWNGVLGSGADSSQGNNGLGGNNVAIENKQSILIFQNIVQATESQGM